MHFVLILGVFTLILCSFLHFYANIFRQTMIGALSTPFPCMEWNKSLGRPTTNVTRLPTALERQLEQVKSISSTKISEYCLTLDQPFQHTQLIIPNTVIIDHSCNLSASLDTASP